MAIIILLLRPDIVGSVSNRAREGSRLSLTWVDVPILFSLGDVSTDVANPFSDSSRIRTYDRLLRRQLLYPAELLSQVDRFPTAVKENI